MIQDHELHDPFEPHNDEARIVYYAMTTLKQLELHMARIGASYTRRLIVGG